MQYLNIIDVKTTKDLKKKTKIENIRHKKENKDRNIAFKFNTFKIYSQQQLESGITKNNETYRRLFFQKAQSVA